MIQRQRGASSLPIMARQESQSAVLTFDNLTKLIDRSTDPRRAKRATAIASCYVGFLRSRGMISRAIVLICFISYL
jgi:hypothetical protein